MRPIHPRIYTHLVTLWLALSLGGIVLGIVVWKRLNQSLDASLRGASFRIDLQNVDRTLEEAEAAARSFGLTGDLADLDRFRANEQLFGKNFAQLTRSAPDQPELRNDLSDLRKTADERFALLTSQIELRQREGLDALLTQGNFTRGRELNARLQTLTDRLEQYPQDLLATHSTAARYELQRALSTTLAAGLFGLGAGVLAFYLSRVALRQEQQQRELSEHALRAERSAQDKSTFLANMSHEIRTPMNAILGFSELLVAELPAGTRGRQHARSIHDSARSLLQLINDILDISKIEASMLELHLEPADVREMIGFLQTVFSQQAAKKNLRLEFSAAANLPDAVMVDRSRIRQVLVNVFGNALKFTERGRVALRILWEENASDATRGTLTFEISDTGVGIPAEKQVQIFEPFVQVDTRRPFEQQGTGLGLSIVQRLTERMGGSVHVRSTVGLGSTFSIRLADVSISSRRPAADLSEADEPVDFNALAPADLLVVDDNAANRQLLACTFDGTHHRVRFATNGREAVERVREKRPSLVLMDLRMPEMDGPTALAEIRKLPGGDTLPIIAVTASHLTEEEKRLRGSFAGYVKKPFTRPILYREMASFLPQRAGAPARTESTPRDLDVSSDPTKWPALIVQMRRLEQGAWSKVRESGAINEIKDFASKLGALARSHACPSLAEYSAALAGDADLYAVTQTEQRLAEYPALIGKIEALAAPAAKEPSAVAGRS